MNQPQGASTTWGGDLANRPPPDLFFQHSQSHSPLVAQKVREKRAVSVDVQSTTPKSDRLRVPTQTGATLAVVLALLLLASAGVMLGLRLLNQGQALARDELDQLRTMALAQALLRDAEQDLAQAQRTPSSALNWPTRLGELTALAQHLSAASPQGCAAGLCLSDAVAAWHDARWHGLGVDDAFWQTGAQLGEFSGSGTANRPRLGRYWVEVLVRAPSSLEASLASPNTSPVQSPFVYRITAKAFGLRPGTQVVLQSLVIREDRP